MRLRAVKRGGKNAEEGKLTDVSIPQGQRRWGQTGSSSSRRDSNLLNRVGDNGSQGGGRGAGGGGMEAEESYNCR